MNTDVTEALSPPTFDAVPAPREARARAQSFQAVYAAWFTVVHRWVQALGGGGADVEDLTQEIFLIVQRKLPEFDGENLAGWLYRIAQRTVRDHRRTSWFRRVWSGRRDLSEDLVDTSASSIELLERKQDRLRFYRIVDRMNAKWRDAFILFEVVGHSGEDIAALKGIPAATVRTHLARARKQFVALVAEEGEA